MKKGEKMSEELKKKHSLAKIGPKNPMYGKKLSKKHKNKISRGIILFYINNPQARKIVGDKRRGERNASWLGDLVGKYGVHDWIKSVKGLAKNYKCEKEDKTCKGRLEWSNKSQKYLRRLYDWQILCQSHHSRYDKHKHINGIKYRFKKGMIPWNKGKKLIK